MFLHNELCFFFLSHPLSCATISHSYDDLRRAFFPPRMCPVEQNGVVVRKKLRLIGTLFRARVLVGDTAMYRAIEYL